MNINHKGKFTLAVKFGVDVGVVREKIRILASVRYNSCFW